MPMLSEFEMSVRQRVGARSPDEAAASKPARPVAPELLGSAKPAGALQARQDGRHTISLTTAYGEVVAAEDVPDAEFGAALRRIHDEAISRASAVVVIDGMTHTRNSFMEFVRAFNDWAARQQGRAA